jgi:penicillin-binding protein 1C
VIRDDRRSKLLFFVKKSQKTFLFFLFFISVAFLLDRLLPPDFSRLSHMGAETVDRSGHTLALLPAPGGVWRFPAKVTDIPSSFCDLLVRTEDRRFWWHPGVDPLAMARAAVQWARNGRIVSGGSTLTMQVVRLLAPRPRTIVSKVIEILRALQLEAHYSKRDILAMWLTLAPYGGNLEGVRAGALAWFGRPPQSLSPEQSALLVAIPRRPEALRPDRHPQAARAIRDRILAQAAQTETTEDIPHNRHPFPRHVPQILAGLSGEPRVVTTLDLALQEAVERLAEAKQSALPTHESMALLIADLPTREIRALFAGYWQDEGRAGALDLTRAIRSPGSALKPFIYALAFADGLAGPETRLPDLPHRFGGYAPEDYGRGFAGNVTAAEALRRSLNLPAVELLQQVGALRYVQTLKAAGVLLHQPAGADPSLPLALGGAGISLRNAAGLYAALATDGQMAPLRLKPEGAVVSRPLLQLHAAQSVADILTQDFPEGGPTGIAWKTGTSWGGRDAWALGFDRAHVAAVWLGRPDGTPVPEATGRSLALPILARLFELLPPAPRMATGPAATLGHDSLINPAAADSLRLLFPPPGAVLSHDGLVTVRVMGGRRPLAFMVDGQVLPSERYRRDAAWTPAGPGFYRLTVLDAEGSAVHAEVRVK